MSIHSHFTRLAVWACTALLGSACSFAPPHQPVAMELPTQFRQEGIWMPTAEPAPTAADWWRVFKDPVLDQLQAGLEASSPSIQVAAAQYRKALAALDSAQAAQVPSVNSSLGATRARNSSGNNSVVVSTNPPTNLYSLSAQAAWELDLWGRVGNTVAAADAELQASQSALAAARLSAQSLLAQAYFVWRAAQAQEASLAQALEAAKRFEALTRNRLEAGVASPLDQAQAETQTHSIEAQWFESRLQRVQAQNAMASLLGQIPSAWEAPGTELSLDASTVPAMPALVPSGVLQGRYDIHRAERLVAAANARIGVAKAAFFPVLNLSASTGFRSNQWSNLVETPARFWSLGPSLALSLFDGGLRSAAVAQANATYDEAVANYRQTVLNAFEEVENNLAALQYLGQERQAQARALALATRSLQIAENQYKAGVGDSLHVITAQLAKWSAERASIQLWNRSMAAAVLLYTNTAGRLVQSSPSQ